MTFSSLGNSDRFKLIVRVDGLRLNLTVLTSDLFVTAQPAQSVRDV